jgi:hypothetical protein
MKCTISNLLDSYRRADFSKRLHLYLQYRDLRSEFSEIERNGLRPEALKGRPRKECSSAICVGTLTHLMGGTCEKALRDHLDSKWEWRSVKSFCFPFFWCLGRGSNSHEA